MIINYPACRHIDGRYWYGGRGFKAKQDVIDAMSDGNGDGLSNGRHVRRVT